MTLTVFAALLFAAFLHAVWNALVRRDPDRRAAATAVAAGGFATGSLLLPFLPSISAAAIPYVLSTSVIHVLYFALVARAYRDGELSVTYPIMRGLAPLIVTIAAAAFVETPTAIATAGILVVTAGVVSLGLDGLRRSGGGLTSAFANAAVIALYTLVDGLGARVSGAPETYVAWIMVGAGIATVGWQILTAGRAMLAPLRKRILTTGLAGGAMSYAAYGIAVWAMTFTPIGAVAAVRESSVLFATAIGAIALHESFGWTRWVAAVLVAGGLVLVKLG